MGARSSISIFAYADTVMGRPTATLLREVSLDGPVHGAISGTRSLFATDTGRWDPGWGSQHTWRGEAPTRTRGV